MLYGTPDVFCKMLHFDGDALGSQNFIMVSPVS